MRELTKSTLSAGLAMSLFGIQTILSAVRRPQAPGAKSAQDSIDLVTQAFVDNTAGPLRQAFQAGDKIQRGLVDVTLSFLTMGAMRPGGGMSMMADAAKQATDRLGSMMTGMAGMAGMTGGRPGGCGCTDPTSPAPPSSPGFSAGTAPGAAGPVQSWGPMPN